MPHQCTNCGHTFPDGSKEMLSGCPDCGGNKFQFKPAGTSDDQSTPDSTSANQPAAEPSTQQSGGEPQSSRTPPEATGDDGGFVSKEPVDAGESPAQSSARSDVVSPGELTAAGTAPPSETTEDEEPSSTPQSETPDQPTTSTEPSASTDRSSDPAPSPTSTDQAASSDADQPGSDSNQPASSDADQVASSDADESSESSLDELRKELNNQFESIRIVSPGQYELNLMELYDRDEYIISLREDGRYVIEVPDGWGDS